MENIRDGIWVKYNRESKEEISEKRLKGEVPGYVKIYQSLKPYVFSVKEEWDGTKMSWNVVSSGIDLTREIMSKGYCFVYYTKDENGEYKNPRLSIYVYDDMHCLVEGRESGNRLEFGFEEILDEKLKEIPGVKIDDYNEKLENARMIKSMDRKMQQGEDLTYADLKFLYGLVPNRNSFGEIYIKKMHEIIDTRDKKKDLASLFNCNEEQISLDKDNVLDNQIYYDGYTFICNFKDVDKIFIPEATRFLYLNKLENAKGLIIPKGVLSIHLDNLKSIEDLNIIECYCMEISLNGVTDAKKVKLQDKFIMVSLNGIEDAEGLELSESVKVVYLNGLKSAKNLKLPNGVREVHLDGLEDAEGLELPESVEVVYLNGLKSAINLKLPESVEVVHLNGLEDTKSLVLPKRVIEISFGNLSCVDEYEVPKHVGKIIFNNMFLFEKLKFVSGENKPYISYYKNTCGLYSRNVIENYFNINSDEDLMLLRTFLCIIESGRIEEYNKEIKDFCMLHDIIILQKNDGSLSDEGLRFLYEMDSSIYKNSKIMNTMYERIITKRNRKEDLAKLFNCSEDMISIDKGNVLDNQIYYDGYTFVYNGNKDIVIPKVTKELYLNGVEDIKEIVIPEGVLVVWYKEKKYSREEFLDLQKKSMYGFNGTPKTEYSDVGPARGDRVARVLKPDGFVSNTIILTNIILFGILSFIITLLILK